MARRKRPGSKYVSVKADRLYGNTKIAKLTNMMMYDGKHSIAYGIVTGALDMMYEHHIKKSTPDLKAQAETKPVKKTATKTDKDEAEGGEVEASSSTTVIAPKASKEEVVNELFEKVLEAASPRVEVKSRRIGGANYQVPIEVRSTRKLTLTLRWLIKFSRARAGKNMVSKLAHELIDTLEGKSNTLRERENIHRMAMANQAFANFKR